MSYLVKKNTYAIYKNGKKTIIIESNKIKKVDESTNNIIDYNCRINGSSIEGRQKGSAYLLGTKYKMPIIINELDNIIFIPTHSIRNKECLWLNLSAIMKYYKVNNKTTVMFINNKKLTINITYSKLDKQILKATRLESILRMRKNKKYL